MPLPLLTSAPGKVIIFGEHSAVFNEPAVAASVSALRTYLLVSAAQDPKVVELDFPDIKFDKQWSGEALATIAAGVQPEAVTDSRELNADLSNALESLLQPLSGSLHYQAAYCFLYMYFSLCGTRTGVKFTVKSSLPIGAGLGSSASLAVCLALALGKLGGHLKHGTESLTKEELAFVNKWSFIGEKCIHGTPSGIDNMVATYGSAVLFQRLPSGETKSEQILSFPQIPMVLTNTRIPRSTKVLVAGVKDLIVRQPEVMKPILESMGVVASSGAQILSQLTDANYESLCELVRVNHGLLVALGVSHPGLELIKSVSDSMNIGHTKLTGAGGGGCALTLLSRGARPEEVEKFKRTLESEHNYKTYTTGLGGPGCGYIAPELVQQNFSSIEPLFRKDSTASDLNKVLLPSSGSFQWIH